MTGATDGVDGLLWGVSRLADRDGVSKQAISKAVKRLVETHGLDVRRDHRGAIVGVNVAHYDQLRARVADPSKAQAPTPVPARRELDPESYDAAATRKMQYDAEMARLRTEEMKRRLVPVDDVAATLDAIADLVVASFDRLAARSDEIAAAVGRDGSPGARRVLRAMAHQARGELADAIATAMSRQPVAGSAEVEAA